MRGFWYRVLHGSGRLLGSWIFVVVSRIIAAGYFCFSGRTVEGRRFYVALYPEKDRLFHSWCVFKQYQNFTTIHVDRFLTGRGLAPRFTSDGWEKLEAATGSEGAILLMSHLGNWEMAAQLLKRQKKDLQMLLYMGIKEKEGVEGIQKEELRRAGITIIGVEQYGGSPFSAIEGIRCLQKGGLVSMTGDILWQPDQRRVRVDFLGHDVRLPEAPYVFALVSGAPLFAFFAFRTGTNSYHFTLEGPIIVRARSRKDRNTMITRAAQQYADLLEHALRKHPCQWYHFEQFLGNRSEIDC